MISSVEGIIVSETPYGNTSKIINVFTKEHGIIGILANGVKTLKSPLRTKTLKFTYGRFHIYYKEEKLSRLKDVDIIDNLNNIKNDIELFSYLSYIVELTTQVVKQNKDDEIYNLLIATITKLNEKQNPLILTNILEIKMLDYLGVGLNLDSCIKCGNKKNIVTLDPDEGGFICQDCYTDQKILSQKSIQLIRMYYLIDINSISKIDIKDEISSEINYFLDKYYERYTGLYLKSKDFLKTINKIK